MQEHYVIPSDSMDSIINEWSKKHLSNQIDESLKHTAGYARAYIALFDLKEKFAPFVVVPQPLNMDGNNVQLGNGCD